MKILVNGANGQMGKALRGMIAGGAQEAELAGAVDAFSQGEGILSSLDDFKGQADCLIDFSNHAGTAGMTDYAVRTNLPMVIATTGQNPEELEMIREASKKVPVFFSSNFSLGVAMLVQMTKTVARMFPDAEAEIVETHHDRKLDVPSGTALMLGRAIQSVRPEAKLLVGRHENGKRTRQEVGIHSLRLGNTVGVHEVIFHTGTQAITLKHEAYDRAIFAEGALSAAAFLIHRTPGLYTMEDLAAEK